MMWVLPLIVQLLFAIMTSKAILNFIVFSFLLERLNFSFRIFNIIDQSRSKKIKKKTNGRKKQKLNLAFPLIIDINFH